MQPYYEYEMNALNTTWDLLLNKPYMDVGKPHDDWEIPGAKTAVQVSRHAQSIRRYRPGVDGGNRVPLESPFRNARHTGPPAEGEQWAHQFLARRMAGDRSMAVMQKFPNTPEDNWVWSPQGVVDMHRPEMWGLVQFTSLPLENKIEVESIPGKTAREIALEIYYSQRVFRQANHRWATNVAEPRMAYGPRARRIRSGRLLEMTEGTVMFVPFHSNKAAGIAPGAFGRTDC